MWDTAHRWHLGTQGERLGGGEAPVPPKDPPQGKDSVWLPNADAAGAGLGLSRCGGSTQQFGALCGNSGLCRPPTVFNHV